MLLNKEVEIKLSSANIRYYENLGYEIPRRRRSSKVSKNDLTVPIGSTITVKAEDIPKGSHVKVYIKCDYCGKVFQKSNHKYYEQRETSIVKKDCCDDCKQLKTKESMLLKYGVERNVQIEDIKAKMSERRRLDEDIVRKAFLKNNLSIIEDDFNYINDTTAINFICNKHPELGVQTTTYTILRSGGKGCKSCRYESISESNCHMWKGGTTPIHTYLRGKIRDWKLSTMKACDYKCILTGLDFEVIHHIYGFNEIVNEIIRNTNIKLRDEIKEYTNEELKILEEECKRLHDKYGLGVCLVEDLHKLYHSTNMGKFDTQETFDNFKNDYLRGKYDDQLEEHLKSYNIIIKL